MLTAEALLATILAHPRDDAPRMRYAELAEARGDPRGLVIRDQLRVRAERRRSPDFQRFVSPVVGELVRTHPEWTAEAVALGATDVRMWGGFVEEIAMPAAAFVAAAPALFALAPIVALHAPGRGAVAALGASPYLARLLALDLHASELTDADAAALAAHPHLRGLEALELASNRITERGAIALATGLPALRYLGLDGNPCGPLWVSDWTPQELPTLEWVATPLVAAIRAGGGRVPMTPAPPHVDTLGAPR